MSCGRCSTGSEASTQIRPGRTKDNGAIMKRPWDGSEQPKLNTGDPVRGPTKKRHTQENKARRREKQRAHESKTTGPHMVASSTSPPQTQQHQHIVVECFHLAWHKNIQHTRHCWNTMSTTLSSQYGSAMVGGDDGGNDREGTTHICFRPSGHESATGSKRKEEPIAR